MNKYEDLLEKYLEAYFERVSEDYTQAELIYDILVYFSDNPASFLEVQKIRDSVLASRLYDQTNDDAIFLKENF